MWDTVLHKYVKDGQTFEIEYKTDLCYSPEWLQEKDIPGWQVQLSTGEMVYEDDERPGYLPSAWERLAYHCNKTGSYIVNMWIRFRDHVECVGSEKEGFYLFKEIRHHPAWKKPTFLYIGGYLEDDLIKCKKWKLPEIIVDETENRKLPGGNTVVLGLPALIRKKDVPIKVS
jgi:hypothetical protein